MTSLDPLYTIGNQLMEPILRHRGLGAAQARDGGAAAAQAGADSRSRAADEILSARAVGRPAPARDDRHGARQRPRHADRRRADDRARRHHPGADPGAAGRVAEASSAWPSSSSPTISASSGASPTASMSCAAARWSRTGATEADLHQAAASLHQDAAGRRADRPQGAAAQPDAPILLEGSNVEVTFKIGGGFLAGEPMLLQRRRPHQHRRCARARPSASSANPARANRRSAARLLRLLPSEGVIRFGDRDISDADRAGHAAAAARTAARLPGPVRLAVAAHDGRPDHHRGAAGA